MISVGTHAASGDTPSELKCCAIPGVAADDAFVLVQPEPGSDNGAGFDRLMQDIRTEVREPLLADDRIELLRLLQKAWAEVDPPALQRGVKLRLCAQTEASRLATPCGSEKWLSRVFQECQESAVRGTRRDGLLDIEHRQLGPLVGNSSWHDFVLDIQHGERVLWVDPEKTHRALTNVLGNAIKYSPNGGVVRVSTQLGKVRQEPAIGLKVTDRGIGMTQEQLGRVFERFYRADPSGNIPGTGLGMSLVKEIVELQGGRVDIASEPGIGTTVTLWFPMASATQPALPAA